MCFREMGEAMLRKLSLSAALLCAIIPSASLADPVPPAIAAAVSDTGRPSEDLARDAARKPTEMLVFAGIKPGDSVLELLPGGGYFTRIFSKAVGPNGHVYAAVPDPKSADAEPQAAAIAQLPGYGNITVITFTPDALKALPPLDIVWTSQNYHDLHLSRVHADMAALDKLWFSILKPSGVVVIVDHAALPGSPPVETADKLHRIDPTVVKMEMGAAGFVLDGESDALRNPADPHTAIVFDPSIRGKTDQFVFRFKKPQ